MKINSSDIIDGFLLQAKREAEDAAQEIRSISPSILASNEITVAEIELKSALECIKHARQVLQATEITVSNF